jgi:hypothetical protein
LVTDSKGYGFASAVEVTTRVGELVCPSLLLDNFPSWTRLSRYSPNVTARTDTKNKSIIIVKAFCSTEPKEDDTNTTLDKRSDCAKIPHLVNK